MLLGSVVGLNPPDMKSIPKSALDHPYFGFAVNYLNYALNEQHIEEPSDFPSFIFAAPVSWIGFRICQIRRCAWLTLNRLTAWKDEPDYGRCLVD